MADGLSVAASIAGLVSVTDIVVRRLHGYIKAAKNAEKEIAALTAEITSLYGILNSLHLVACRFEGEELDTTMQIHHIYSCHQTLLKITALLDKDDPRASKNTMNSFRKKLHWPLSKSETNKLTAEVERHKATLSLALSADGVSALLKALSRQAEIGTEIQDMAGELRTDRETRARVAIDAERKRILEYVGKIDPKANQATGLKLRQPGTGTWFTDGPEFRNWLSTNNAKLWLFGIPGAGKTVLTSTIIQEAEKQSPKGDGIAYFFCDYKDSATQDVVNILGALVRQFAIQDEQSFEILENYYQRHLPQKAHALVPTGSPTPPTAEELHGLIQVMTKSFDNALIIVDALDECTGDRSTVMELLESLNKPGANNIKTLFTSRDEYDIRARLADYVSVSIAARSSDLRLYVASEFELRMRNKKLRVRDPTLKEEIMTRLVEGAEGMFRWVTCQMDHLCELNNDRARREALKSLPPDLPSTYERILERVNASSEENQIMVQRALRWIVCAERPLSLAALAEAITINEGDKRLDRDAIPDEDAILRWCSSLVRKSVGSENLELAHFTVKEFLLAIDPVKQHPVQAYRVQIMQCQAELAKTCLTYLCFEDFAGHLHTNWDDYDQQNTTYPFRSYAVNYWIKHAWETNEDESLLELMKTLFEPVKSNQFISWSQEYVLNYAEEIEGYYVKVNFAHFACQTADSTLLHWAAILALPAICQWLLMEGCDVNKPSKAFESPLCCAILGTHILGHAYDVEEDLIIIGPSEARDKVVKLLVEHGANVNYHLDCGPASISILLVTLGQGESAITRTRILLEAGALCDKRCIDYVAEQVSSEDSHLMDFLDNIEPRNLQGECNAQFVELAFSFESCPKEEILDKMKSDSTAEDQETFKDHFPALLKAVEFGAIGSVRKLISIYKTGLNVDRLCTLLHTAAAAGHAEVIHALIQDGADVHNKDKEGRIPLHHAARNGDLRSFLILVEKGSKIRQADKDGLTVAHIAALHNNLEILETLESMSDARLGLMSRAQDGRTPLLCAAFSGSKEVVKFILSRFDNVDVSECAEDGRSCLHLAASGRSPEYATEKLRLFLDRGLDVNQRTRDGSTPLHFAALRHEACEEVIELLLTHGADSSALREDGCSALHLLNQNHGLYMSGEAVSLLSPAMDEISLNAKAGDENGYTALHYCVSEIKIPQYHQHYGALLDHTDINVNVLDNHQSTPLHLFIKIFRSEWTQDCCNFLEKLIGKGAVVDQKDISGRTPLHDLCDVFYSDVDISFEKAVRILLDHGADPTTEAADGKSTYLILLEKLGKTINEAKNPRSTAVIDGCARMLTAILQYAAKPLPDIRVNGVSPLSLALQTRRDYLVEKLLSFEPDVDRRDEDEFRRTPLEVACTFGCSTSVAAKLVSLSTRLDDKDHFGGSLLRRAAWYGSVEILVELLNLGLGIDTMNSSGSTPLMIASAIGKVDTVQLLIDKGADVAAKNCNGWSVVHAAVGKGRLDVLLLLQSTAIDWEAKTTMQVAGIVITASTALHMAAGYGHNNIIEFLLGSGRFQDVNLPTDTHHIRPLHIATAAHHTHTVGLLLSKGADVNLVIATGLLMTALHLAAANGFGDIVCLLVEHGGDLKKTDSQGMTPELLALQRGHKSVVEMLRKAGAEQGIIVEQSSDAQSNNLVSIVESSPERLSSDDAKRALQIDQTSDIAASQALKVAIEVGSFDLCTRLVKDGVNVNDGLGCCSNCTPLLYSLHYHRPEIAHLLVESGATYSEITCECWDTQGYDTIHYAASYGYAGLLKLLLEKVPKPRPPWVVDPVHLAAAGGYLECLELLLDHDLQPCEAPISSNFEIQSSPCVKSKTNGIPDAIFENLDDDLSSEYSEENAPCKLVDVRIQDRILDRPWRLNDELESSARFVSATALHIASCSGNVKIACLLLQRGADIEACNADEMTALYWATSYGRRDIVQLLLEAGANINCRDFQGRTPAMLASENGDLEILELLREHKADFSASDRIGAGCIHFAAWSSQVLVLPGLFALGQDLSLADNLGVSALHDALMARSTNMETFLIDHATINGTCDPYCGNVLNVACQYASLAVVHWILERMPEGKEHPFVNFRSTENSTPLIAAVYRGQSRMVNALLNAGADIELSDGQFGSPLMTACALGRLEVAKLLVKRGAKLEYCEDGTLAAMAIAAHHKNVQDWLRRFQDGKPETSLCMKSGSGVVEEVDA